MLICRNAEGAHRQRKVWNPCSRVITKLFNKTMQKLSANLSNGGLTTSLKKGPRGDFKICGFCQNFKKNVVISSQLIIFRNSDIFRTVLVFSYLQTQLTKFVELWKFYQAISLRYSKAQDNRL